MKKIYASLVLALIGLSTYTNPIALPTIEISELYFDDSANWKLELGYLGIGQNGLTIDSIFLYSTSDTVKLPKIDFIGSTGVVVITNDSLDNDFVIKRFADTIKVVSYTMEQPFEDELIYGNSSNAAITYPRQGQSISKYGMYFVKDNSPTIGAINDTLGMCGTINGIVYDKSLAPVQNRTFRMDFEFETSINGEYMTRVLSKPSIFSQLYYRTEDHSTQSISISEIIYTAEPDSVIELDIYLLDTLYSGINNIMYNENPIKVFPNPVSLNQKLNVNVELPTMTSNIWLELFDIDGKLILKQKIYQKDNLLKMPLTEGSYIICVLLDNRVISSNRVLVTSE